MQSNLTSNAADARRGERKRSSSPVVALAGGFLILFLNRYRDSVNDTSPVTVLVAKSLIEKGSSGDVIATRLYREHTLTKQERPDAIPIPPAA